MPRERFRYDAVVKDLFQKDRPTLLGMLAGPAEVREFLNSELPVVETRVADMLVALSDDSILHIEFQSNNHREMPYRMGLYGLLASQKYKRKKIRQVVVYMGSAPVRMPNQLDLGEIQIAYRLVDIREFDVRVLLASGKPGDVALAMLARDGVERLGDIVRRASELPEAERRRVLTQMTVLAGLRQLTEQFRMEMKNMGVYIDIEKNVILREIRDAGRAEGKVEGMGLLLEGMLKGKFGPLPRWASSRLHAATAEQVQEWGVRLLKADTIEGVLGKR